MSIVRRLPREHVVGARIDYRLTFVALAVGAMSFALMQAMVSPILPLLERRLHTGPSGVAWVLTAYLLAASIATPILGRLGDMVGKDRILLVVLATLAVGSFIGALAPNLGVLVAGRAIQGLGGGLIPLSFGVIRDEFPGAKIPSAVGTISALLAVGGGVGIVLAGPIEHALGYRWLFWLPGIVTVCVLVMTYFVVPSSPVRTPGRINWLAALVLSGWLVCLLLAVSDASSWGWTSGRVVLLLAAAVIGAGLWVTIEVRSSQPLIDMRMMRLPTVWTTNLCSLLMGAGLYSMGAFLPAFLQTPSAAGYGFGASVTESGLIVLPQTGAMFVFGIMSGPLARRYGSKAVLIAGTSLSCLSFMLLAFAHAHLWTVIIALVVQGVSFGLGYSAMSVLIVESVPSHQTGVASGMNANIRTVGGALGTAIVASVISAAVQRSGFPKEAGYVVGFALLGCAMAVAALFATIIPSRHPKLDPHQQEQLSMSHAELAAIAGGTLVGDEPE